MNSSAADEPGPSSAGRPPRDRAVLRRAVLAGLVVWAALGGVLGVGLAPGGVRAAVAGVLLGLAAGGIVSAGWATLALALDLLADRPPSSWRVRWTAVLGACGLGMPLLAAVVTP